MDLITLKYLQWITLKGKGVRITASMAHFDGFEDLEGSQSEEQLDDPGGEELDQEVGHYFGEVSEEEQDELRRNSSVCSTDWMQTPFSEYAGGTSTSSAARQASVPSPMTNHSSRQQSRGRGNLQSGMSTPLSSRADSTASARGRASRRSTPLSSTFNSPSRPTSSASSRFSSTSPGPSRANTPLGAVGGRNTPGLSSAYDSLHLASESGDVIDDAEEINDLGTATTLEEHGDEAGTGDVEEDGSSQRREGEHDNVLDANANFELGGEEEDNIEVAHEEAHLAPEDKARLQKKLIPLEIVPGKIFHTLSCTMGHKFVTTGYENKKGVTSWNILLKNKMYKLDMASKLRTKQGFYTHSYYCR